MDVFVWIVSENCTILLGDCQDDDIRGGGDAGKGIEEKQREGAGSLDSWFLRGLSLSRERKLRRGIGKSSPNS